MNGYKVHCSEQPKDEHGKTQAWYDAMHKRKGHGTNQFTKARELGLPIPKGPNTGKEGYWKGKHLTEETKRKISDKQKQNLKNGKVFGYKLNHSSKVSYPEKYFMDVFKELPVEYNYQVGLYQLDFALPGKKVYVEIDGEQHYIDPKVVEHDKIRTQRLEELGWKCLKRIRWSMYEKLDDNEKLNLVKNIKNQII